MVRIVLGSMALGKDVGMVLHSTLVLVRSKDRMGCCHSNTQLKQ
jgi:hypothetical protein